MRSLLQKAPKPQRVSDSAWERLQEMLCSHVDFPELIANFEWSVGSGNLPEVEERIKVGLVKAGDAADAAEANQLFERLFVVVFKRLSDPGLTSHHYGVARRSSTTPVSDRGDELVAFIRSQLAGLDRRLMDVEQAVAASTTNLAGLSAAVKSIAAAQHVVASIDFAGPAVTLDIPDLVKPLISRSDAVNVTHILAQKSSVGIIGEPRLSKHNFVALWQGS